MSVEWKKSSRCSTAEGCIEVAFVEGGVAVRDSAQPDGPVLLFTPDEWDAFVGGAKDGEFDV